MIISMLLLLLLLLSSLRCVIRPENGSAPPIDLANSATGEEIGLEIIYWCHRCDCFGGISRHVLCVCMRETVFIYKSPWTQLSSKIGIK